MASIYMLVDWKTLQKIWIINWAGLYCLLALLRFMTRKTTIIFRISG